MLLTHNTYNKYYIKTGIEKLKDDGLIELQQDGDSHFFVLTPKGDARLAIHDKTNLLEPSNKKWDGKWRVVIFDIKESERATRDRLRERLTDIGFIKIQNSVWIFPYDCEEFIFLLKTDFELGRNVLFMTVDKLENDKWVRKTFGLNNPNGRVFK